MPTVWQLTRERYLDTAFSCAGAKQYGGRFNRPETALVYTASSLALAVLEVMANVDDYDTLLIRRLVAIPAHVPEDLVRSVDIGGDHTWRIGAYEVKVPNWRAEPPPAALQRLGTTWAERQMSVGLRVPSAVIPHEDNVLLNPHHPAFEAVETQRPVDPLIDPRLAVG